MTIPSDNDRENLALDALIALALRDLSLGSPPDLTQTEVELSPEDEAALAELPPDLVDRIINGEWPPAKTRHDAALPAVDLTVAMNRSESEELTERAREEMERRLREAEEAESQQGDIDDADDRIED